MMTKEKYVMGEHIYLVEEKCIQAIEKELDSFFELRLKSVCLIPELYIKGSLRNLDDLLNFLNLSNFEIKNLIETVVYKINYNLCHETIYLNMDNEIKNHTESIENSIYEFRKTELVLSLYEKFLDKSISKIFKTFFQSKILNYVFDKSNLHEKILSNHSMKKQKQNHSDIISNHILGFILNLKCDLRNDLVKSTLLLINSIY